MRFEGTDTYVVTEDLQVAVNAAITLERPLLVKGEPGTGKTVLAYEIADALGAPLIEWHIKSTTKAQHGLYEYDAVAQLRDGQLGDERVHDISNYIVRGKLWEAFDSTARPVVLIDEIRLQRGETDNLLTAILNSGTSRLRPVAMAASTTALGMIPLLLDAFFVAMAVTIISGLMFATLLTMIIVPVLYAIFYGASGDASESASATN